jgi:acetyltransferase-like isoleucine patch superfamily enzyme
MLSVFKKLLKVPNDVWLGFITHLPGEIGFVLRRRYWRTRLRHLGNHVKLDTGIYFQNPEFIYIDDNCWIDKNVVIMAGMDYSSREKIVLNNKAFKGEPGVVYVGKNIHIGPSCIISGISAGVYISDDCGFSAHCKIYAFSHHYRSRKSPKDTTAHFGPMAPHERQCLIIGPVQVGANTGVALNSVILPGASIPENCFVAINSVVSSGKFTANSIISGNPAKKVDARFKSNE